MKLDYQIQKWRASLFPLSDSLFFILLEVRFTHFSGYFCQQKYQENQENMVQEVFEPLQSVTFETSLRLGN